MERYQVDERQAFAMLRDHARHSGQKLVHVAQAVLDGHLLLPASPGADGDHRPGSRVGSAPEEGTRHRATHSSSALESSSSTRASRSPIASPTSGGAARTCASDTP